MSVIPYFHPVWPNADSYLDTHVARVGMSGFQEHWNYVDMTLHALAISRNVGKVCFCCDYRKQNCACTTKVWAT